MKTLIAAAALVAFWVTVSLAQTPSQTSPTGNSTTSGSTTNLAGPATLPNSGGRRTNPRAAAADQSGDHAVQDEDRLIDTKIKNICVRC